MQGDGARVSRDDAPRRGRPAVTARVLVSPLLLNQVVDAGGRPRDVGRDVVAVAAPRDGDRSDKSHKPAGLSQAEHEIVIFSVDRPLRETTGAVEYLALD